MSNRPTVNHLSRKGNNVQLRKDDGEQFKKRKNDDNFIVPSHTKARSTQSIQDPSTVLSFIAMSLQANPTTPSEDLLERLNVVRAMSQKGENLDKLLSSGVIYKMIQVFKQYPKKPDHIVEAMRTLGGISYEQRGANAIVMCGGHDMIASLISHICPKVANSALEVVGYLAYGDPERRRKLFQNQAIISNVFDPKDVMMVANAAFATGSLLSDLDPPLIFLENVTEKLHVFVVQTVKDLVMGRQNCASLECIGDLFEAYSKAVTRQSEYYVASMITKEFVEQTILRSMTMYKTVASIPCAIAHIFRKAATVEGVRDLFFGNTFLSSMCWFITGSKLKTGPALRDMMEGLSTIAMHTESITGLMNQLSNDFGEHILWAAERGKHQYKKPALKLLAMVYLRGEPNLALFYKDGVGPMSDTLRGSNDTDQIIEILNALVAILEHSTVGMERHWNIKEMIEERGGLDAINKLMYSRNNTEIFRLCNAIVKHWSDDETDDQNEGPHDQDVSSTGVNLSNKFDMGAQFQNATSFGGTSFQNGM